MAENSNTPYPTNYPLPPHPQGGAWYPPPPYHLNPSFLLPSAHHPQYIPSYAVEYPARGEEEGVEVVEEEGEEGEGEDTMYDDDDEEGRRRGEGEDDGETLQLSDEFLNGSAAPNASIIAPACMRAREPAEMKVINSLSLLNIITRIVKKVIQKSPVDLIFSKQMFIRNNWLSKQTYAIGFKAKLITQFLVTAIQQYQLLDADEADLSTLHKVRVLPKAFALAKMKPPRGSVAARAARPVLNTSPHKRPAPPKRALIRPALEMGGEVVHVGGEGERAGRVGGEGERRGGGGDGQVELVEVGESTNNNNNITRNTNTITNTANSFSNTTDTNTNKNSIHSTNNTSLIQTNTSNTNTSTNNISDTQTNTSNTNATNNITNNKITNNTSTTNEDTEEEDEGEKERERDRERDGERDREKELDADTEEELDPSLTLPPTSPSPSPSPFHPTSTSPSPSLHEPLSKSIRSTRTTPPTPSSSSSSTSLPLPIPIPASSSSTSSSSSSPSSTSLSLPTPTSTPTGRALRPVAIKHEPVEYPEEYGYPGGYYPYDMYQPTKKARTIPSRTLVPHIYKTSPTPLPPPPSERDNWMEFLTRVGRSEESVKGWPVDAVREELELQNFRGAKKGDVLNVWRALQG